MARRRSSVKPPRNPFPSYRFSPDGKERKLFQTEAEVPEGWVRRPNLTAQEDKGAEGGDRSLEGKEGANAWDSVPLAEPEEIFDDEDDLPPPPKRTKKLKKR